MFKRIVRYPILLVVTPLLLIGMVFLLCIWTPLEVTIWSVTPDYEWRKGDTAKLIRDVRHLLAAWRWQCSTNVTATNSTT